MEQHSGSVKRKNRLAVFEHVVEKAKKIKKRRAPNRFNSEYSSPSESELVIDDEPSPVKKKKKSPLMKLTEEPLSLQCDWNNCSDVYNTWKQFNAHLLEHASHYSVNEKITCEWEKCNTNLETIPLLMQHMSYHAYIAKLMNIGQNITLRNKLPACSETNKSDIPVVPEGYKCEWEYCFNYFCTIYEFLDHMHVHIKNNPKMANAKEVILCCWKDCNTKYSSQTKLAEHVRTHTKEKIVGCPSCGKLFSNKTKYCDHRKRQLSSELQSYQCSQCLKLFPSERLLRDHMRSHVNHYKCTMCDMTCPKPSILAKHIRFKHINFKPYKCPECDKKFVEKYNLRTHLKTHELKNPLKCCVCDFGCRSGVGLENHYVKKHDAVGLIYECHCCKKKFKRGSYLTKHLTKQHNYHWPSGHSRFRYRKDQDGIYRLQTVRYESLEVTQEMIRSEIMPTNTVKESASYSLKYDNGKSGYVLTVSKDGEQCVTNTQDDNGDKNILITINDVDDQGNILNSQDIESRIVPANELPSFDNVLPVSTNRNKPIERNDDSETDSVLKQRKSDPLDEDPKLVGTILDYEMFKNS